MANKEQYPGWPGWQTVRLIGRGSFGSVYEIERDVVGDGDVEKAALKHISIPQSDSEIDELRSEGLDNASITETFREQVKEIANEYRLMKKLNDCPYVVSCDDVRIVQHEEDLGWDIFIRMELLTPLLKLLGDTPDFPEEQIVRLGTDLCRALAYCHKRKIIHRDIKPQNIFVSSEGIYKLGDFGIARVKAGSSTGTGKIGTYDYMAPEVFHAEHYGTSADIYSLGMVLYWLLNRRRNPFQSLDKLRLSLEDKQEARKLRFSGEEIPAPAHGSAELKRIVLKACAYDPKDRYRSAEEMLRDLEALSTPSVPRRSTPPAEPAIPQPDPIEPEKPELPYGGTVGAFGGEAAKEPEEDDDVTVDVFDRKDPDEPQPPPVKKTPRGLIGGIAALLALLLIAFFTIHSWKPATCTEPETCRICGKTRGEALGHRYTEATCLEAAVCTVCGDVSTGATGHDWGEWTVVSEPTCTEEGLRQRICANDPSHVETEAIPAKGHTWKDATCTEPSVCTVCGDVSTGATGHDWGEPEYTWSADNSSVTAKRTCRHDPSHVEEETVKTNSEITKAAGFATKGKITYTAAFLNSAFGTQQKQVNIPATGYNAEIGSYVVFGTYEQDNNSANGKEDIEWLVLAKEGNRLLVISRYALDCKQYNTESKAVTWENCSLRSWLNDSFLNTAFSAEEQAHIPTVTVSADKNPSYSTDPGRNTEDRAFLLSIAEAKQYFASDEARMCAPTTFAKANGCYVSDNGSCWWWLRSPGNAASDAAIVYSVGSVIAIGYLVNYDLSAVRPALWIDLGS